MNKPISTTLVRRNKNALGFDGEEASTKKRESLALAQVRRDRDTQAGTY